MKRTTVLARLLVCAMSSLAAGCGKNVAEQMMLDMARGCGARFQDGMLDGHRVYGYDASYLHGSLLKAIERRKDEIGRLSGDDVGALFPLVYFVALKYEDPPRATGGERGERSFRMQIGAIDYLPSSGDRHGDVALELPSSSKCFTFLMVGESNRVEILSVDLSRNFKRGSRVLGRFCSYGSVDAEIQIWDAYMEDRNRPEKILAGRYGKAFAVKTDRPFNYMEYTKPGRLEFLELLHAGSVYRLCWHTPECMVFIPEALLPKSVGRPAVCSGGLHEM